MPDTPWNKAYKPVKVYIEPAHILQKDPPREHCSVEMHPDSYTGANLSWYDLIPKGEHSGSEGRRQENDRQERKG